MAWKALANKLLKLVIDKILKPSSDRYNKFRGWWHEASPHLRLYALGLILYGMWFILFLFSPKRGDWLFVVGLAAFCLGTGFMWELARTIKNNWSSKYAKIATGLLSLLFIAIRWISKIAADQTINLFIPINPSHFARSSQALTWLFFVVICVYLLPLCLILLMEIAFFGIFLRCLLFPVEELFRPLWAFVQKVIIGKEGQNRQVSDKELAFCFARLLGAFVVLILLVLSFVYVYNLIHVQEIGHALDLLISSIIAFTDHYTLSMCTNHDFASGERVAFIDDQRISVAIPDAQYGGYRFEIRICNPR